MQQDGSVGDVYWLARTPGMYSSRSALVAPGNLFSCDRKRVNMISPPCVRLQARERHRACQLHQLHVLWERRGTFEAYWATAPHRKIVSYNVHVMDSHVMVVAYRALEAVLAQGRTGEHDEVAGRPQQLGHRLRIPAEDAAQCSVLSILVFMC